MNRLVLISMCMCIMSITSYVTATKDTLQIIVATLDYLDILQSNVVTLFSRY